MIVTSNQDLPFSANKLEKHTAEQRKRSIRNETQQLQNETAATYQRLARIVLALGAVVAIISIASLSTVPSAVGILITSIIVGLFGFLFLRTISEVIQILHDIRRKLYEEKSDTNHNKKG